MLLRLNRLNQVVCIDAGELVGYQVGEHEYIHHKGSPGWGNSDTEMFPVIGPTKDVGYIVKTPKGDASLDQHGLLRELDYQLVSRTETTAVYVKTYSANTTVKNSKYPKRSTQEDLSWPYDFKFVKTFDLGEDGLEITFVISGAEGMPFMLGYHPAFKIQTGSSEIRTNNNTISLNEIVAVGSGAYPILDCNELVLRDKREIKIKTTGFNNFMLWTEVDTMLCIEPITYYPKVGQKLTLDNFRKLDGTGEEEFKIHFMVDS